MMNHKVTTTRKENEQMKPSRGTAKVITDIVLAAKNPKDAVSRVAAFLDALTDSTCTTEAKIAAKLGWSK
jgi:hypothetical protein